MGSDALKNFRRLRRSLLKEKAVIEIRLAQLTEALGMEVFYTPPQQLGWRLELRRNRKHFKNKVTLREAVRLVTAQRPMTKEEILKELRDQGYRFNTEDPDASLTAILRGKGQFTKKRGRYRSR